MSPRLPHRGPYGRSVQRIGSRLARLRYKRRLTQAFIATQLGVHESTYRRLEASDFIPDQYLPGIAAALGLSADALENHLENRSVELAQGSRRAS